MLVAEKGAGAFRDGVRQITAAPKGDLTKLTGHAGVKYFPENLRGSIKDFRKQAGSVFTLSCACHEYLRIVSGESDFGIYSEARPWDHLAGVLAVREAGGIATQWDGSPYKATDEFGGVLVAGSQDTWNLVHRAVVKKMVEDFKKTP